MELVPGGDVRKLCLDLQLKKTVLPPAPGEGKGLFAYKRAIAAPARVGKHYSNDFKSVLPTPAHIIATADADRRMALPSVAAAPIDIVTVASAGRGDFEDEMRTDLQTIQRRKR